MDRSVLPYIVDGFLRPRLDFLNEMDEAIRGQRGPRLVSVRVLMAGLVYLFMTQRTKTITKLAQVLAYEATPEQLASLMGKGWDPEYREHSAPKAPSVWQLYRTLAALRSALRGIERAGDRRGDALRALLGADSEAEALDKLGFRRSSCQVLWKLLPGRRVRWSGGSALHVAGGSSSKSTVMEAFSVQEQGQLVAAVDGAPVGAEPQNHLEDQVEGVLPGAQALGGVGP